MIFFLQFSQSISEYLMNEWTVDVDRRIYKGIEVGMLRGFIKEGDPIVIVTGMSFCHMVSVW